MHAYNSYYTTFFKEKKTIEFETLSSLLERN